MQLLDLNHDGAMEVVIFSSRYSYTEDSTSYTEHYRDRVEARRGAGDVLWNHVSEGTDSYSWRERGVPFFSLYYADTSRVNNLLWNLDPTGDVDGDGWDELFATYAYAQYSEETGTRLPVDPEPPADYSRVESRIISGASGSVSNGPRAETTSPDIADLFPLEEGNSVRAAALTDADGPGRTLTGLSLDGDVLWTRPVGVGYGFAGPVGVRGEGNTDIAVYFWDEDTGEGFLTVRGSDGATLIPAGPGYVESHRGDVNADGYADPIVSDYGGIGLSRRLRRVSGLDGTDLWEKPIAGSDYTYPFVWARNDLSGDGADDAIVYQETYDECYNFESGSAEAVDGAGGVTMWTAAYSGWLGMPFPALPNGDFNSNGTDDLATARIEEGPPGAPRTVITLHEGSDSAPLWSATSSLTPEFLWNFAGDLRGTGEDELIADFWDVAEAFDMDGEIWTF